MSDEPVRRMTSEVVILRERLIAVNFRDTLQLLTVFIIFWSTLNLPWTSLVPLE